MKSKQTDKIPLRMHAPALLAEARARFRAGDPVLAAAVSDLRVGADRVLKERPHTLADKAQTPPSGDKRDYMSIGPYWWPDPETPDGLPYIRRDGERNPEYDSGDQPSLVAMVNAVETLALAWFFLGESAYADCGVEHLRVFFLHEDSRMNPHLAFGEAVPGRCAGRPYGIIGTVKFATILIDMIELLRASSRLCSAEYEGLRAWFDRYLDWLLKSDLGRGEKKGKNNHGTAYDLQVAAFSLFTGREKAARSVVASVPERRIRPQIEPDGRQPYELERTLALHYSAANLYFFFHLAGIAASLGLDLWHFRSADGRSMQKALDWLLPFLTQSQPWPYSQIAPFPYALAYDLLRRAAWAYGAGTYEKALSKLPLEPGHTARLRTNLYSPAMG